MTDKIININNNKTAAAGLRIGEISRTALFASLLAVCSQIAIPLPMIPVNLGLLAVYYAGLLLKGKEALLSVCLFLLMGAVGVPVFAGFRGGPAVLFDKTGGYLLGYLATVAIVSLLRPWAATFWKKSLACFLGMICCYALGTAWFMYLTGLSWQPAVLRVCSVPYEAPEWGIN